jgi:adenylate kinase family enzyme
MKSAHSKTKDEITKKQPLNIILLGDPAAGKATHGEFFAKRHNMYDLDMGRELRGLEKNKALRKKYKLDKTLNSGKLTPTELVRKLLQDKIHSTSSKQGILFNGTPKMLGEAKLVAKWLKQEKRNRVLFVYLSIPLKETIRRMTSRETYFQGKFSKRPDDNDKALKNRISYYKKNISQVVKYFKTLYPYTKISTTGSIEQARTRLIKILNKFEE